MVYSKGGQAYSPAGENSHVACADLQRDNVL